MTFLIAGSAYEYISSSKLWLAVLTSLPEVQNKCLTTIMLKPRRGDYFQLYEWIKMRNLNNCCSLGQYRWLLWKTAAKYVFCEAAYICCVFGLEVCVISSLEILNSNQQGNCTFFSYKSDYYICIITLCFDFSTSFYVSSIYTNLGFYCALARFIQSLFTYYRLADLTNSQQNIMVVSQISICDAPQIRRSVLSLPGPLQFPVGYLWVTPLQQCCCWLLVHKYNTNAL